MSTFQTMDSSAAFRELLIKYRQEKASSSSFMSWFAPTEDTTSSSSSFWWESNFDERDASLKDLYTTRDFSSSPQKECDTNTKKQYNASYTSHWLAYEDQDNSCSSSDEEDSYEPSISSASSVYSEEEDDGKYRVEEEEYSEYDEEEEYLTEDYPQDSSDKYLLALGWWKVYRSGWWEHSEGASTHFDDTYVEYRFSALLPPISEEENRLP